MTPKKLQQTNRQDWVFIRPPGSFDQHRRSNHMRGTACYALPEKTRSNLYAMKRHNIMMSTATLQETAFHRSRGCKPE
jgi:hypothetical protein